MLAGLGSFAFTWGVGLPGATPSRPLVEGDLVAETARLGFDVLQLADNTSVADRDPAELAGLADEARAAGVRLELGGRGLTAEALRHHLVVAHALDARVLRFVIDAPGHEPHASELITLLRASCRSLEETGVTLALENHDRFTAAELAGIVRAVDDARVGVCLDTVNSIGAGEGLEEVLRLLGPLTVNLHVKDFAIRRRPHGMGFEVLGARLGTGMLDLPAVLEAVADHGRCTTAVLEQWAPERPRPEDAAALERAWVEESSTVLRRTLDARRSTPLHEGAHRTP